ncbi:MAG: TetR/AcrR family transcriptional regulator [Stackebrandtia sp.]
MTEAGTAERITAAARAILIQEGAQAVTMRRVAADAGVTAMATYRHFPNRQALLRTVADAAFAELSADWGRHDDVGDFASRISRMQDAFLDFALGQPNLYTFLMTDRRDGARRFPADYEASPTFAPMVALAEQGMRDGTLRVDDPLEVAMTLVAQVMGLLQLHLGGRVSLSEPEFRALCKRSTERILDGLRQ